MTVLHEFDSGGRAVILRTATADDVARIVALLAADPLRAGTGGASNDEELAPYLRAFEQIDDDPAHLLVVADRDGEIVGTMQISFLPGIARRGALRTQLEAGAGCGRRAVEGHRLGDGHLGRRRGAAARLRAGAADVAHLAHGRPPVLRPAGVSPPRTPGSSSRSETQDERSGRSRCASSNSSRVVSRAATRPEIDAAPSHMYITTIW